MSFTVTIETGNDAMCEPGHVGEQLRRIADSLDEGFTSGPVVDLNGNTVGSFDYSSDDDDAGLGNCVAVEVDAVLERKAQEWLDRRSGR